MIRLALFGIDCAFTAGVLSAIDRERINVVRIVLPQSPPITSRRPTIQLISNLKTHVALQTAIPVTHLDCEASLCEILTADQLDTIAVACFPSKLPQSILTCSKNGGLNVHPSLLPRHRGPEPLFWTFREGDTMSGVTIHALTDRFDAGPILSQSPLDLLPETRGEELEPALASLGGQLLTDITIEPHRDGVPQIEERATWAPIPRGADRAIEQTWTAERAFRFARGSGRMFGPLTLNPENGSLFPIYDAVWFGKTLHAPFPGQEVARFSDGYVCFQTSPSSNEP